MDQQKKSKKIRHLFKNYRFVNLYAFHMTFEVFQEFDKPWKIVNDESTESTNYTKAIDVLCPHCHPIEPVAKNIQNIY